jgi:hypothetical protein
MSVNKKAWRKPEIKTIAAGSAEQGAKVAGFSDANNTKS